jgi:hypothetical protein
VQTKVFAFEGQDWKVGIPALEEVEPQLILTFMGPAQSRDPGPVTALRKRFPDALVASCSTGGEIAGLDVFDESVVGVAIRFEAARVRAHMVDLAGAGNDAEAGRALAVALMEPGLKAVLILGDGINLNGTALIKGLSRELPKDVVVTGGLAGDGANFGETRVGLDDQPQPGKVVGIGLYGESLSVGWGSTGGWEPFGPLRQITRSDANVLFELDGKPALDLYREYLGPLAEGLPGTALLFPLTIRPEATSENDVVRTIVGIDEANNGLVFAGDIPEGWTAQLMRGTPDQLADGAARAAAQANGDRLDPGLALVVSCIGRKLMMGQRVADETEEMAQALNAMPTVGFYSYGEIAPHSVTQDRTLHNQTMTVTVIRESA